MIHFNSIAFCCYDLVRIRGEQERKVNACFYKLWLIEACRPCLSSVWNFLGGEDVSPLENKISEFWDSGRMEDTVVYSTQDR